MKNLQLFTMSVLLSFVTVNKGISKNGFDTEYNDNAS